MVRPAVIMASYSRPERLPIIKQLLQDQTYKDFDFYVIDNTIDNKGARERFKEVLRHDNNPITLIREMKNMI